MLNWPFSFLIVLSYASERLKHYKKTSQKDITRRRIKDCRRRRHKNKNMWEIAVKGETKEKDACIRKDEFWVPLQ